MRRELTYITMASLLAVAPLAYADSINIRHTKTDQASGASIDTEASTTTKKNWDGSVETINKESTTVDPKGLNNQVNASTQQERVNHANGDFSKKDKIQHADGTYEEASEKRTTSKHILDDGKTTTTTKSKVVDPKGLGNKQQNSTEEKVVENPDGTQSKTITETRTNQ